MNRANCVQIAHVMRGYRFCVNNLAGKAAQKTRRRILEIVTGGKVTLAQCGFNAVRDAMLDTFPQIDRELKCAARIDRELSILMELYASEKVG